MQNTINAFVVNTFSKELQELRSRYFPGPLAHSADAFDKRSEYMILEHNNSIIATGRITPNPGGPLISETNGAAPFRNLPDTVDLGKYLIVKEYQGIVGLYEMLCLAVNEYVLNSGYLFANAGIAVGNRLIRRLHPMGYKAIGDAVPIRLSNGNTANIIPLICDLKQNEPAMHAQIAQWSASLADRGWRIERAYA